MLQPYSTTIMHILQLNHHAIMLGFAMKQSDLWAMFSLLTSGKRFGYHIGFQLEPIHLSGYSTLNGFFYKSGLKKF